MTQVSLEGGQERSKHSILVVEDELLLRLDLSNQLRMEGLRCDRSRYRRRGS